MGNKLAQIVTDLKSSGTWDWVVSPNGDLHPNDERALLNGCWFDVTTATSIQRFYSRLLTLPHEAGSRVGDYELQSIRMCHPKWDPDKPGRKKPFGLLRFWHRQVMAPMWAWRSADGSRRFRRGFITTSKKTGKTTTMAGLPIYELLVGQEYEKEVYVVGVTEDQAGILYRKAYQMYQRASKAIQGKLCCRPSQRSIVNPKTGSLFKTLPADADTVQGIEPNILILDELHAWRNREVYDALIYGDIRRSNSLTVSITTAGDDVNGIGYEEYEAARDLLDPDNDRYEEDSFAFIAERGRDPITGQYSEVPWDSEEAIRQGNPTLAENDQQIGTLLQRRDGARNSPLKKRNYIRYICNNYVDAVAETWIDPKRWDLCKREIPDYRVDGGYKRPVWLGLDLARVDDLVSLCYAFLADDNHFDLKWRFWMPEEGIQHKVESWKLPQLNQWIEEGFIETTPGWVVDHAYIRKAVSGVVLDENGKPLPKKDPEAAAQLYDIRELAYDKWQADNLVVASLKAFDGIPCLEHSQAYTGMSAPCKEFHRRVLDKSVHHDGNPVLRWMTRHCVIDIDPSDNIKPNKLKSRHKIDGIVAAVMALGRATLGRGKSSTYNRRGVLRV